MPNCNISRHLVASIPSEYKYQWTIYNFAIYYKESMTSRIKFILSNNVIMPH